jgi:uncharacterized protein (TIGR02266 family)
MCTPEPARNARIFQRRTGRANAGPAMASELHPRRPSMVTQPQEMERTRQKEARRDRRAHIPHVSVTYEAEPGRLVVGDALEMSQGGVFIRAPKPVAARSLIEIEVRVLGEPSPISAIGRVIWTREVDEGEGRPSGMGVRFIDMDDAARAVIAQLVAVRQPTMYGIGATPALPAQADPVAVRPMQASIPFCLVTRKGPPASRVASDADAQAAE